MSHHHCYSWAAAMAANLGYSTDDSYFSALPLFHTDAQMFGVYLPLIYGPGDAGRRVQRLAFLGAGS